MKSSEKKIDKSQVFKLGICLRISIRWNIEVCSFNISLILGGMEGVSNL
jgi:hypothetical protein